MLAKDNGGSDDRRDDPPNSGSHDTPSAEGGAEGSEGRRLTQAMFEEHAPAFMQAMFEEHARTISLKLQEDLRAAQDEFIPLVGCITNGKKQKARPVLIAAAARCLEQGLCLGGLRRGGKSRRPRPRPPTGQLSRRAAETC